MTDDGFAKIWGGTGATRLGVFVRWTFGMREDGSVLAIVGVRLSDRHEWHEISRRAFPHDLRGDARDWVRSVIAAYNVGPPEPREDESEASDED